MKKNISLMSIIKKPNIGSLLIVRLNYKGLFIKVFYHKKIYVFFRCSCLFGDPIVLVYFHAFTVLMFELII
jgi:hypothetical protein